MSTEQNKLLFRMPIFLVIRKKGRVQHSLSLQIENIDHCIKVYAKHILGAIGKIL